MVRWVLAFAVVAAAASCAADEPSSPGQALAGPATVQATVTEIVDGDTIHVDLDGRDTAVRLIGIDTPEKEGRYTHLECYGEEATRHTAELLDGRSVGLEFDVERTDRYERTLAYVWIGDELVNETILRDGYAQLLTIPPDVAYVDRFRAAERDAREAGRGLWGACPL